MAGSELVEESRVFSEDRFFRHNHVKDIWQRYCGFLDLSLPEYMEIQEYLLLEQIKLVENSPLGKAIMKNYRPASVEEFRQMVPITTYQDYAPHIGNCQEDGLVEKPLFWCHTAGRGGNFKWIPYTASAFEKLSKNMMAGGILAAANKKGDVRLRPGARLLLIVAPRPYASGSLFYHLPRHLTFHSIPPLPQAEALEFTQRVEIGFETALKEGVDLIFSASSVLAKIGESFVEKEQKPKFSTRMLHPAVFARLARAWLISRTQRRKKLPKDLWPVKAIGTFGVDTAIYRDDIIRYWGRIPYEIYGATEMILSAMQTWAKSGMIFLPDMAFWEFIPEEERLRGEEDSGYRPATVLMNELEEGQRYEAVYTHFYGMPLMRYRIGDLFKVVTLADEETGVRLPHFTFLARTSEVIDLAGLTQLDEKTMWQAIANTGVEYEDWCTHKEYDRNRSFLRLYLELKEERPVAEIERLIDEQLKAIDVDYRDLEGWLGLQPVRVTLLSRGTFRRYREEKRRVGAGLFDLKPPHINTPDGIIQQLLQLSRKEQTQVTP